MMIFQSKRSSIPISYFGSNLQRLALKENTLIELAMKSPEPARELDTVKILRSLLIRITVGKKYSFLKVCSPMKTETIPLAPTFVIHPTVLIHLTRKKAAPSL